RNRETTERNTADRQSLRFHRVYDLLRNKSEVMKICLHKPLLITTGQDTESGSTTTGWHRGNWGWNVRLLAAAATTGRPGGIAVLRCRAARSSTSTAGISVLGCR